MTESPQRLPGARAGREIDCKWDEGIFRGDEIIYILIGVVVTWVYAFIKTHLTGLPWWRSG